MRRDAEIQAITNYLLGAVQYVTEEEALGEVQRLAGGNVRLAREARRNLDSRSMWPRGRAEGLLGHLREDYQYDRVMRLLDAIIDRKPLAPPPIELRAIFEADRRADDVVQDTYELVHEGVTDEEILRQMAGDGLSDGTKQRLVLRCGKESAVTSNHRRAVRVLLQLAGELSEESEDEVDLIPGMDDFYDLSDEEAFQRIAVEVPRLLTLRDVIEPEPSPVSADLPFREYLRQSRKHRKGPEGPQQQEWRRNVWQVMTELKQLVGPDASQGSELVRSDVALFKCAHVLLPGRSMPPTDADGTKPQ